MQPRTHGTTTRTERSGAKLDPDRYTYMYKRDLRN
jgi:hypothetical protein